MRPTWAEIDLKALVKNFYRVREIVGNRVKIMSVVKADAYGHGAVKVSQVLQEAGSAMLGVATIDEAVELRESGITIPIVILSGVYDDEFDLVIKHNLSPVVYSLDNLVALNTNAYKNKVKVKFHLKIDTGMNRLGITPDNISKFLEVMNTCSNLTVYGVLTHFSSADSEDKSYTYHQLKLFDESLHQIRKYFSHIPFIHAANSSALQRFPVSHYNLVRPGIMLYGSCGDDDIYLQPVMKLMTRIIQIKDLDKGERVSYGGTFKTSKPTKIAVLPLGYADGYMRNLSNKAEVSVNGSTASVIGRVCMDLTIIDVTGIKSINVGDDVSLFGDNRVNIDQLASKAGTISYEMLSLVGKRVLRIYKGY